MNFSEANELADRINANNMGTTGTLPEAQATVVRILSEDVDPIKDGDNGWDVEVEVLSDD